MVLHGTNGFEPELLKKCVAAGVSKINVNRLVLDNYQAHLRAHASHLSQTTLMEEGVQEVVNQTVEWMQICGSAGRAKSAS
jgi:fructose-bisphosphate aldolase, class II